MEWVFYCHFFTTHRAVCSLRFRRLLSVHLECVHDRGQRLGSSRDPIDWRAGIAASYTISPLYWAGYHIPLSLQPRHLFSRCAFVSSISHP